MARSQPQAWRCRRLTVHTRPNESRTNALARFFQRVHELGLGNPHEHAQTKRTPDREAA